MKKTVKVLFLFGLFSALPAAQACSIMDVWDAWRFAADTDKDKQVSLDEWRKMGDNPSDRDFKRKFRVSCAEFRRLDGDGNGFLDESELSALRDKLDYVRSPCAAWEEKMRRRIIRP